MSGYSSIRRLVIAVSMTLLLPCIALAGMEDKVLSFSTTGPDRYADGTVVADGECYALVWSPKGAFFAGFNADGTAISPADRVVLAGALARGGKCRDSLFQVPAEEYAELADGEWKVCLVDTRMANGVPAGVGANGVPRRVNRWGEVKATVKVEPGAVSALRLFATQRSESRGLKTATALDEESDEDDGACAGVLSAVPASVKQPKITAFEVSDGVVRLTVEDTVPFLTYTLASGDTPNALATDDAADAVDGVVGQAIAIETDATEGSRFFKVTRAE